MGTPHCHLEFVEPVPDLPQHANSHPFFKTILICLFLVPLSRPRILWHPIYLLPRPLLHLPLLVHLMTRPLSSTSLHIHLFFQFILLPHHLAYHLLHRTPPYNLPTLPYYIGHIPPLSTSPCPLSLPGRPLLYPFLSLSLALHVALSLYLFPTRFC